MSSVIHRTTNHYLVSVNTPDYAPETWLVNPDLSAVAGVPQKYWKVSGDTVVEMSTEEKAVVNAALSQAYVESVISGAIAFGQKLVTSYAAQNVLLGITQAGMTATVRTRMATVLAALQTGSLYDAMAAARAIPTADKDGTFINDARLLEFVNKIEVYLNITPVSTTL